MFQDKSPDPNQMPDAAKSQSQETATSQQKGPFVLPKDMAESSSAKASTPERLQDAPEISSSQSPTKYGSCQQTSPHVWEVVMWRVPTNITQQERDFSRQCTRSFPPTTKKHNFHPISAALMIRCPIGGGTCNHSIINIKNPKGSAFTHFSIHRRNGDHYNIKIEGSFNHCLPRPPPAVRSARHQLL